MSAILTDRPHLGEYDDDHIEAWRLCVKPDHLDQRIVRALDARRATERHLNFFLISATILGVTRDAALARLLERAVLVRIYLDEQERMAAAIDGEEEA